MIQNNIEIIESQISQKCSELKRERSEIKLVAVSKFNPPESIVTAFESGIIHFGENKAQEFCDKAEKIQEEIFWHFIGHLQSNKVKNVVKYAHYIHSVDSLNIAGEINKRAASIKKIQNVLLEFKTSDEDSKFGISDETEVYRIAEFCKNSSNLNILGLMTMAPFVEDEKIIRNSFSTLRLLFEKMNNRGFGLSELSMGMTGDWQLALEEGSTMLRIGTAIFGARY